MVTTSARARSSRKHAQSALGDSKSSEAPRNTTCSAKNILILAVDSTGSCLSAAYQLCYRLESNWGNLVMLFGSDDIEIVVVAFGDAKFDPGEALFVSEPLRGPKFNFNFQSATIGRGGADGRESPELAAFYISRCIDIGEAEQVFCFFFTDEPGSDLVDTPVVCRELGIRPALFFILPEEVIQDGECWEHVGRHFALDLQDLRKLFGVEDLEVQFVPPAETERIWPQLEPREGLAEARARFEQVCHFGHDPERAGSSRFAFTSRVDYQLRQSAFCFHFPKESAVRRGGYGEKTFDHSLFGQETSEQVFEELTGRMHVNACVFPSETVGFDDGSANRWWEKMLPERLLTIPSGELALESMLLTIANTLRPEVKNLYPLVGATPPDDTQRALSGLLSQLAWRHRDPSTFFTF